MSMKYPTQAGIEPATFRFVALHLNHCATAVPGCSVVDIVILVVVIVVVAVVLVVVVVVVVVVA